ncbi:polyisoprenoid-binding protein [Streptomyces sp. NWU339]|uniref:YceI family protein n=1 Tax=Streptomyces sp. NWU339 TaxID=2185284 RepID=UPI000D68371D|nr:YceI family protein [Streptomyces sp. NWU339]PWI09062.1 polyisoprenoid-binding protein [Streptomyces sp. NWU339]
MDFRSLFRNARSADTEPTPSPAPPTGAGARPFVADPSRAQLSGQWMFDQAHSTVGFAARHAVVTRVRGSFTGFDGWLQLDGARPERSGAGVVIRADTVNTRVAQRDRHLCSADFLDAERYPTITFRSTHIEQVGEDRFRMTGALTVKGRTHPITVDLLYTGSVVDAFGVERIGFDGTAVLNRTQWDLTWNAVLETGGLMVSEEIELEFDISAVRAP